MTISARRDSTSPPLTVDAFLAVCDAWREADRRRFSAPALAPDPFAFSRLDFYSRLYSAPLHRAWTTAHLGDFA